MAGGGGTISSRVQVLAQPWKGQGRTSTGPNHDAMVRSRTQYHYVVRWIQRKEQEMRSWKLLEAAMDGDLSLLKEMKKVKG